MMDLLKHLIPDFAHMFSANPNGISAWFWSATALIFGLSLYFLFVHFRRFRTRLRALRSLLEGQSKETLALSRRETMQKAQGLDAPNVGMLWREFDESLVLSSDQKHLFNTLDAEHFFNARTLAPGLTASRLLAAAPSFLVAIGVLGTFVGLTVGLEGLVGTSDEIESLKGGINKLISGAAVAFMTSVWGVFFSLLLNFVEKMFERSALGQIQQLQHDIDFLYPRIPAEQSLVHIAEYGKESKEALQELHERIGDRLQETLNGMSEAMQTALTDALNNIMAPAIQTLVSTTSQQSTQVLEKLVGNFMDGMTSVGREQGLQMQQAAADVNAAVSGMSERLNQLFSSLNEQQGRQMEVAQQQSAAFETQLQRISGSAEERQAQMEQRFAELMSGLTNQLQTQLGAAQQRDEERQVLFERVLGQASSSQTAMLEQFSNSTREQMQAMAEAGNERHNNLEKVFSRLMMNLNTQLDSQMGAAEQREQARQQRFQEQLDQVSTHQQELLSGLASAVQATQQQSRLMADQHQQLLGQLKQVSEATAQSSKHLDSSANQLGLLSANLRQAADTLGQRLEAVTHGVEKAGQQNAELAAQLQSQAATLAQLQATLLEGAQRFEQAAGEARNGFGEMKSAQQEFLSGVRHEFTALGEKLREQVEAVEKQAEEWLRSYAGEVRTQIDDRMNKWNEVSLSYADQMHRTVQAMSSILDELEAR
ncbi:TPA: anti-phage ZorAB system protein ZorA [Pseudomonas aeruginosa]|uniref:Methyl-accepting chemotaxis protein n=1 Tax=Pseudomonas paraeruginosa TaxID=2994495 RepID=A0A2R3IR70_9PSED|nr:MULTISPECIES: anti-phage ZorAB system protein ZorA [Pseudomonas aeruginosa group]AVK04137.1 putative methyl-accepting chemotaxis protein [Pseudomonas paraeruginosa]AWE92279.1 putative methyl-accepting chemotaxis protein [Pseudomonas paraeruginosa]KSD74108.1 chemotaxis protein [Pseudomonas aeruginosa]MBI8451765.1 anti-phage defense ZorAB system ZorA [Pseudomonas aeruginosa]MBV6015102.1 anti-phage defense ZorAB system protein ZorA [Pseudomonas aeruginosa]